MKADLIVRYGVVLGLVLGLTGLSGCGVPGSVQSGEGRIVAAVSIPPQKAMVEAVCGDLAEIVVMVPPGKSPGNYEPTAAEMERFQRADVYFTIGVATEAAHLLPLAGDKQIVDLAAAVAAVHPDRQFDGGGRDPHIWLSPQRARVMVEKIRDAFAEMDAANGSVYRERAAAYLARIDEVDAAIRKKLEGSTKRDFLMFHPSLGYFADAYGLHMHALEEDGKEASPRHLQEMIDLAVQHDIHVVFTQAEIGSARQDAFVEEIGGRVVVLEPLSAAYPDNLLTIASALAEALQ